MTFEKRLEALEKKIDALLAPAIPPTPSDDRVCIDTTALIGSLSTYSIKAGINVADKGNADAILQNALAAYIQSEVKAAISQAAGSNASAILENALAMHPRSS